jgi:hypothetical protein
VKGPVGEHDRTRVRQVPGDDRIVVRVHGDCCSGPMRRGVV